MTIMPISPELLGAFGRLSGQPNFNSPTEPFQWGGGGSRVPQGQIDRDRQIADALMAVDTSPVYSPWQGLARVLQGATGALMERGARKSEAENARLDSERMAQLLSGGEPSGASGSASPAAGGQNWASIAFNPSAGPQERAYAQYMMEQGDKLRMKQMEIDNRPPPEAVKLARIANDQSAPETERAAAQAALLNITDPFTTFTGPDVGTYHGRQSGLGQYLGGVAGSPPAGMGPQVGSIVDGFRFNGGNPKDKSSWSPVGSSNASAQGDPMTAAEGSKSITRAQLAPIMSSYGRDSTDKWLRNYNIKVVD